LLRPEESDFSTYYKRLGLFVKPAISSVFILERLAIPAIVTQFLYNPANKDDDGNCGNEREWQNLDEFI
jgi:hypothetical protein